ncbi:MAG TPA: DUF2231 domain-containing protein [Acetobacteraceae bacterium]
MTRSRGHPILRLLAAFPIACFTCALFTDLAYVQTANIMWVNFSDWLLAVGMAGGVVAAVAGTLTLVANRRRRTQRFNWAVALGSLVVLVIALFNNFVHSRDAWTSVMPTGLALSAATVVAVLVTAWLAANTDHRRDVAMPYSGVRQ